MQGLYREIGSEFWQPDITSNRRNKICVRNYLILLSGRTALDYIIQDLKSEKNLKSVCLPSYCCHTIIKPFLDNGIDVEFYEVSLQGDSFEYMIDLSSNCDAVFLMQYFGFANLAVKDFIKALKNKGKVVIEDATHSWFSEFPYSALSDYVFASLRKWTGLSGGAFVIKQSGNFLVPNPTKINHEYLEIRQKATALKKQYIEEGHGNKEDYLNLFEKAERLLEKDYRNYFVPDQVRKNILSIDFAKIRSKRRINAKTLSKDLQEHEVIKTLKIKQSDVPLFFPLFLPRRMRDALRKHLIRNNIFCPVHWPISKYHQITNDFLYKNSLSLVCDQRYSSKDMEYLSHVIIDFISKWS